MQDRPTVVEAVEAVVEFLASQAVPQTEGQLSFKLRVAPNLLRIVQRELELGPSLHTAESARLEALLGRWGPLADLNAELAERIADGSLDDRWAKVVEHVRLSARDRLLVANPKYLDEAD
jgi:hypothetical protein